VLLAIFVVAVVIVCSVEAYSAWSRIGTGIITGSFIGMIGALVNYIHQRSVFWKEFADLCWKIANNLLEYRIEATHYNQYLGESTKEQIIEEAIKSCESNDERINEMKENCESLALQCQEDSYAPFFFWNRSLTPFHNLCDEIRDNFRYLYGERMMCRTFDLIDKSKPKEELDIVIGDSEEFYKDTWNRCMDYQGIIEYDCHQFSLVINQIMAHGFGKTLSGYTRELMNLSAGLAISGIENKDVEDIRSKRVKDEEDEPQEEVVERKIKLNMRKLIEHMKSYGHVYLIGVGCAIALMAIVFLELNVGFRFYIVGSQAVADGWNHIWLSLSYSYLAGVILYYFTVRLPYKLECQRLRSVIVFKLQNIGVTIDTMSIEFRVNSKNPSLEEIDEIIPLMTPEKWRSKRKTPFHDGVTVWDAVICDYREMQKQISQVINDYGKYLTIDELYQLEDIRSSKLDQFISIGENNKTNYADIAYSDIINPCYKELVQVYLRLAHSFEIKLR